VRVDRYRPSYGRSIENRPRTCVLAATSETDDYLTDTRGRRRFWPLRCNDINLDGLHQQRDQLFAEAVARYREGATWHEMPEEADLEQLDRMQDDLWTEQVLSYADTILPRMSGGVMKVMAIPAYVLLDVLKIDLADQTHKEKTRVAGILQRAGWITSKHLGNRCWVKPIRKPKT
jgi:putative DNA primase/helicase